MFCDIKDRLGESNMLRVWAYSVYEATPERMAQKAKEYLENVAQQLYGWFSNKTLLGVCGFIIHADKVEITNISVAEDARSRGVGSAMISSLQKMYKLTITAETDDDAIGFYRKCGFNATAFQKHGVQRWNCVLPYILSSTQIRFVEEADEKTAITRKVMHSLPA